DRNRSHWSTSKTPSYTKSVSWHHHPIRDEAIKAFVVLNEGETLSEEEFFRFCEQNMAKFKVPSYLEIRKDLPRNCSGKIIRKNLK
ncbi:AMP-binding enzyme, partial [Escherichia coli]|uniref:AMP-binding enzyme n=1 Tax=Escherichia coli TaxID=562 RepID=UPI003F7B087D